MTLQEFLSEWNNNEPTILVHTSGSTGAPKPIRVEKSRMRISAERTCRFLGLTKADRALLCMPLDYIAGKMMVVRSLVSGMQLLSVPPSSHPMRNLTQQPSFAAMVPLQVHETLKVKEERERLMRTKNLIIGGGAISAELEKQLQNFPNAVWSTYGMTETLSHIAMRRINGSCSCQFYTPLDGVEIQQAADGCLEIFAPAICPTRLKTNDIVELSADHKSFKILGRKDNVIDSGGIKIQAEQVEALLQPHLSLPFAISKRKDEKFGEAVVLALACADESRKSAEEQKARAVCLRLLPKYWQPKSIVVLHELPLTETGKVARKRLEDMVK